ncbi:MAG TPA: acetoin utilization protein AcuC [Frankiaceae bacterium]
MTAARPAVPDAAPAAGACTTFVADAAEVWDLGRGHPLRGTRAELTRRLAADLGVRGRPGVAVATADLASRALMERAHTPAYLDLLADPRAADALELLRAGLGTADTPLVPRMLSKAAAVAGASAAAATALLEGRAVHAVSLDGGLHHAMPSGASGFCVVNDVVVAVRLLRDAGLRVAYVDLDAHHGDGVEAAFAPDPDTLTISLHQDGRTIFPGTGAATDVGVGAAAGTVVNLPLPPGTADAGWLRAFDAVVPVLLRTFAPDVVVLQAGADGHRLDPLTDLQLTVQGMATAVSRVHRLAHELAGGRLLLLGGGGYSCTDAVPRAWTQALAVVSGEPLGWNTRLPDTWRRAAQQAGGVTVPTVLGDAQADAGLLAGSAWSEPAGWVTAEGWAPYRPWDAGTGDPDDRLDRAVAATRGAVFPLLALDPLIDR